MQNRKGFSCHHFYYICFSYVVGQGGEAAKPSHKIPGLFLEAFLFNRSLCVKIKLHHVFLVFAEADSHPPNLPPLQRMLTVPICRFDHATKPYDASFCFYKAKCCALKPSASFCLNKIQFRLKSMKHQHQVDAKKKLQQ